MATRKKKYTVSYLVDNHLKVKTVHGDQIFHLETYEETDDDGDVMDTKSMLTWIDHNNGNAIGSIYDAHIVADYLNKGTWVEVDYDTPMSGKQNVPRGTTEVDALTDGSIWEPSLNLNTRNNAKRKKIHC
jgi:hypothetical protein